MYFSADDVQCYNPEPLKTPVMDKARIDLSRFEAIFSNMARSHDRYLRHPRSNISSWQDSPVARSEWRTNSTWRVSSA